MPELHRRRSTEAQIITHRRATPPIIDDINTILKDAQLHLNGPSPDFDKAIRYYRRAALLGSNEARYRLASMARAGHFGQQASHQVFREYIQEALRDRKPFELNPNTDHDYKSLQANLLNAMGAIHLESRELSAAMRFFEGAVHGGSAAGAQNLAISILECLARSSEALSPLLEVVDLLTGKMKSQSTLGEELSRCKASQSLSDVLEVISRMARVTVSVLIHLSSKSAKDSSAAESATLRYNMGVAFERGLATDDDSSSSTRLTSRSPHHRCRKISSLTLDGGSHDSIKAAMCYQEANCLKEGGHAKAQLALAKLFIRRFSHRKVRRRKTECVRRWLQAAASGGETDACSILAAAHREGIFSDNGAVSPSNKNLRTEDHSLSSSLSDEKALKVLLGVPASFEPFLEEDPFAGCVQHERVSLTRVSLKSLQQRLHRRTHHASWTGDLSSAQQPPSARPNPHDTGLPHRTSVGRLRSMWSGTQRRRRREERGASWATADIFASSHSSSSAASSTSSSLSAVDAPEAMSSPASNTSSAVLVRGQAPRSSPVSLSDLLAAPQTPTTLRIMNSMRLHAEALEMFQSSRADFMEVCLRLAESYALYPAEHVRAEEPKSVSAALSAAAEQFEQENAAVPEGVYVVLTRFLMYYSSPRSPSSPTFGVDPPIYVARAASKLADMLRSDPLPPPPQCGGGSKLAPSSKLASSSKVQAWHLLLLRARLRLKVLNSAQTAQSDLQAALTCCPPSEQYQIHLLMLHLFAYNLLRRNPPTIESDSIQEAWRILNLYVDQAPLEDLRPIQDFLHLFAAFIPSQQIQQTLTRWQSKRSAQPPTLRVTSISDRVPLWRVGTLTS